jgi:hypothetical protein
MGMFRIKATVPSARVTEKCQRRANVVVFGFGKRNTYSRCQSPRAGERVPGWAVFATAAFSFGQSRFASPEIKKKVSVLYGQSVGGMW